MIPVWWILVAFVAGGWAGLLLTALMRTAADHDASAIEPLRANDRTCSIRSG